jgi:hypothetical protein
VGWLSEENFVVYLICGMRANVMVWQPSSITRIEFGLFDPKLNAGLLQHQLKSRVMREWRDADGGLLAFTASQAGRHKSE